MNSTQEQGSEVARLLTQIREEYEAAVRGINGLAWGAAQHTVINQKMNNMYLWQEELERYVGVEAAIVLVDQQLDACPGINSPVS